MEGKDRFLLVCDRKDLVIKSGYCRLRDKYDIPDENIIFWKNQPTEDDIRAISSISRNQRLCIVAHGDSDCKGIAAKPHDSSNRHVKTEKKSASDVADKLSEMGLREAGILRFESCFSSSEFLHDFHNAAKDRGINFGYISGYEGALASSIFRPGKPTGVSLHVPQRMREKMTPESIQKYNDILSIPNGHFFLSQKNYQVQ
ncbi:MAG: hypothetical protein PQ612_07850 [Rickettsiales bacterium]|nr:hypothetical protein [Pseudomonadota bacterium]MDA0967001.1 hypothetical protein [Pseudomonadota bacterium]MDG4543921.1 hypothetical protein [Rickettsiales bacterium]MDG4546067.1 hypothetical protein [Rickettsiales bacterium]MDG4548313.1 hypothetical protein [Rickettsiales bacterium]